MNEGASNVPWISKKTNLAMKRSTLMVEKSRDASVLIANAIALLRLHPC